MSDEERLDVYSRAPSKDITRRDAMTILSSNDIQAKGKELLANDRKVCR